MGYLGKLECPLCVDLHIFHVLLQVSVCQYSLGNSQNTKKKNIQNKTGDHYYNMERWAASNETSPSRNRTVDNVLFETQSKLEKEEEQVARPM